VTGWRSFGDVRGLYGRSDADRRDHEHRARGETEEAVQN
jgi:hypothetical protein